MSETVYGAFARLEALCAGHPEWWLVTEWPISNTEADDG